MPKVVLFLGAGASRAFDYPTTSEFVHNLTDSVSSEEKRILNSLIRAPTITDIEHVLQTLDPLIALASNSYVETIFNQSPPNIPLVDGSVYWRDFIRWCRSLKDTIISELHRQYEFDRTKLKKVTDAYDPVFGELSMSKDIQHIDVFTTNYDSVIEHYCTNGMKTYQFACGFVRDSRSGREFWNPEELGRWKLDKGFGIKLYKLHGSLDWRETDDNRIERVSTEERVSRATRRYKRNILIYPAQKNYVTEEPFRRLMKYFEEVLNQHDLCLVIGFSFRDPLINGTFLDFLGAERKRRLMVVSPNASTDVKNNLLGDNKKLEKQVICIDKPFGEPETFSLIFDTLEDKLIKAREEE